MKTKSGVVLKPHHHIKVSQEMKADLQIWNVFLQHPSAFARPFADFELVHNAIEIDMYSDASRNFDLGFGGFCKSDWFAEKWDSFVALVKQSIEYLELFAVTVAVLLWIRQFRNMKIQLFCDNKSAVDMINNSTSNCKNCMVLIRLITLEGLKWNVRIKAKHVRSRKNSISDALSRGQYDRFKRLCRLKAKKMQKCKVKIPSELWPIGKIWLN